MTLTSHLLSNSTFVSGTKNVNCLKEYQIYLFRFLSKEVNAMMLFERENKTHTHNIVDPFCWTDIFDRMALHLRFTMIYGISNHPTKYNFIFVITCDSNKSTQYFGNEVITTKWIYSSFDFLIQRTKWLRLRHFRVVILQLRKEKKPTHLIKPFDESILITKYACSESYPWSYLNLWKELMNVYILVGINHNTNEIYIFDD